MSDLVRTQAESFFSSFKHADSLALYIQRGDMSDECDSLFVHESSSPKEVIVHNSNQ